MGHDSPEAIQAEIKKYMMVFAALAVLTIVTVAVSYLNLSIFGAVVVAMIVATVKGTLVAGYFMHLLDEKFTIYWILGLTMLFFVVLMLLPAATFSDHVGASTEVAQEHVEEAH
jgi:cytochrome c oxidase subunit 4